MKWDFLKTLYLSFRYSNKVLGAVFLVLLIAAVVGLATKKTEYKECAGTILWVQYVQYKLTSIIQVCFKMHAIFEVIKIIVLHYETWISSSKKTNNFANTLPHKARSLIHNVGNDNWVTVLKHDTRTHWLLPLGLLIII